MTTLRNHMLAVWLGWPAEGSEVASALKLRYLPSQFLLLQWFHHTELVELVLPHVLQIPHFGRPEIADCSFILTQADGL